MADQPPPYEERSSSGLVGRNVEETKTEKRPYTLVDQVTASRSTLVSAAAEKIHAVLEQRALYGISKTRLVVIPFGHECNLSEPYKIAEFDEKPIVVELTGEHNSAEFWSQAQAIDELRRQTRFMSDMKRPSDCTTHSRAWRSFFANFLASFDFSTSGSTVCLAGSVEVRDWLVGVVVAGASFFVGAEAAAFFLASRRFAFLLAAAEGGSGVAETDSTSSGGRGCVARQSLKLRYQREKPWRLQCDLVDVASRKRNANAQTAKTCNCTFTTFTSSRILTHTTFTMASPALQSVYNTIFRKNYVFLSVVFVSAFGMEIAFDNASNSVWNSINQGVRPSIVRPHRETSTANTLSSANGRTSSKSTWRTTTNSLYLFIQSHVPNSREDTLTCALFFKWSGDCDLSNCPPTADSTNQPFQYCLVTT
ncbi:hypothetical protein KCU81_g54, partial [Aureobasidium melanogenum]